MSICSVILAGGTGSRLWPLSRQLYPKQFLSLHGKETMLQRSMNRLKGLDVKSTITICNEDHRFFVAEQLREIDRLDSIILEPSGRNTAPAIALASFLVKDDPLLLVLPADHVIQDEKSFTKAINAAIPLANSGKLITFGILPTNPNTGYGYIKKGTKKAKGFDVAEFVEKPSGALAKKYFSSGNYFWNSGIFLFKASRYLEELKKFRLDVYEACQSSMKNVQKDLDFFRVDKEKFELCPSVSIDYAVMEKTKDALVLPLDIGWNDIGSWSSLWDISKKDKNGNVVVGDVMLHNSTNSYIRSDGKIVATIGINNLIIICTKDAVLVSHKDSAENMKVIIKELKTNARHELIQHCEVFRPWGKYELIDIGEHYKVKKITVNPGAKLSLQKHHHRAEHWIVVSGEAKVRNGETTFILSQNESTFIPIGATHSLENLGEDELKIIEVQSGSYLGEDDIVRFEDLYGRS